MLKFNSENDLSQINTDNFAYPIIAELVTHYPYIPESDGFIALIEPDDTEFSGNGTWKGIAKVDDVFLAMYQVNNQSAIIFVIPDSNKGFINGITKH